MCSVRVVCVCMCTYICVYACVRTYVCVCARTYVCVCTWPNQLNGIIVLPPGVFELDAVAIHVRKVLLGFCRGAGAQPLVVLYSPCVSALCHGLPTLKLWQAEETLLTASLSGLCATVERWRGKIRHQRITLTLTLTLK